MEKAWRRKCDVPLKESMLKISNKTLKYVQNALNSGTSWYKIDSTVQCMCSPKWAT